jgi:ferric-dicitrate binding protein FerR (iron transport regulator)
VARTIVDRIWTTGAALKQRISVRRLRSRPFRPVNRPRFEPLALSIVLTALLALLRLTGPTPTSGGASSETDIAPRRTAASDGR